jgi:hypothetical protein
MNDEKLKRQLQYHIAARQGPMTGLSSKWDYETGSLLFFFEVFEFNFVSFRYMEKIKDFDLFIGVELTCPYSLFFIRSTLSLVTYIVVHFFFLFHHRKTNKDHV